MLRFFEFCVRDNSKACVSYVNVAGDYVRAREKLVPRT